MNENTTAIIGLAIFGVIWLAPIIFGERVFKRKGYSPHWMWFGILPFVGLVVFAVAFILSPRPRALEALSAQEPEEAAAAYAQYQAGTRQLGNGLIVLGGLYALLGIVVAQEDRTAFAIIGAFAALFFVSGIFARKLHAWVNSVVAVLGCLWLVMTILSVFGQDPRKPNLAASFALVPLLISASLFYYSAKNIRNLRRSLQIRSEANPVADRGSPVASR